MRQSFRVGLILLSTLVILFLFFVRAFAQYENVKDHPALSRYKGSEVVHYDVKEFCEYYILLGPIKGSSDKDIEGAKSKKIEGKVTKFTYVVKNRSGLEVYKNYEIALKNAGYKILFQGKGRKYMVFINFLKRKIGII